MRRGRPGKVKWTPEQDQMIKNLYVELGPTELARRMEVPSSCVRNRAAYFGLVSKVARKWTEEENQIIRENYSKDGPMVLSKRLGVSYWALVAYARRYLDVDVTRKKPPKDFQWTREVLEEIRRRYEEEGGDELAKEFDVSLGTVRRKAAEMGLHTNAGHKRWGKIRSESSTSCDIHYFDNWSNSMAYILGFLFADGGINKKRTGFSVNLKREDDSVLEFIRKELKCSRGLYHSEGKLDSRTGNIGQPQSHLRVSSIVLVKRLIELGLRPRKTYNDDLFPDVPDLYVPHFIRGYLDGDGTTSISSDDVITVGFVGSPKIVGGIRDSLVRIAGMTNKCIGLRRGKTADWANVGWSGLEDIIKFRDFVYSDGFGFCLQRKKDNIDRWLLKERWSNVRKPWTEEEKDVVRENFFRMSVTELARKMDRNRTTVYWQAKKMELDIRARYEIVSDCDDEGG